MTDKEKERFAKIENDLNKLPNVHISDDTVWMINLIKKNEDYIKELLTVIDQTLTLAMSIRRATTPMGEDFGDSGVSELAEKIILTIMRS